MTTAERCPCGRPLHYGSEQAQQAVEDIIAAKGPLIRVTVGGRTWTVPRHYIALHGLRGDEVASLGFEEQREDDDGRPATATD